MSQRRTRSAPGRRWPKRRCVWGRIRRRGFEQHRRGSISQCSRAQDHRCQVISRRCRLGRLRRGGPTHRNRNGGAGSRMDRRQAHRKSGSIQPHQPSSEKEGGRAALPPESRRCPVPSSPLPFRQQQTWRRHPHREGAWVLHLLRAAQAPGGDQERRVLRPLPLPVSRAQRLPNPHILRTRS